MRVSHTTMPKSRGWTSHARPIYWAAPPRNTAKNTEPQGTSLQVGTLRRLRHSPYHHPKSPFLMNAMKIGHYE